MQNQIIKIESALYNSFMIRADEFWIAQDEISNIEKFEKAVAKTGMLKSAFSYPISSITSISYNEASENITIRYKNEKDKIKKLKLSFEEVNDSNNFGQQLGEHLGLTPSSKTEKTWKPLLLNAFYLIGTILITYFLATIEDTAELADGSTRRSRSRGAILQLIVDTIGQTGVVIIGTLISLYLAYRLYNRFKNPANEIVYD